MALEIPDQKMQTNLADVATILRERKLVYKIQLEIVVAVLMPTMQYAAGT